MFEGAFCLLTVCEPFMCLSYFITFIVSVQVFCQHNYWFENETVKFVSTYCFENETVNKVIMS